MEQKDLRTPDRLLLRGLEVAQMMGCSRALAYRLMQRGVLPVVRIPGGKTVRVPREALEAWIRKNTVSGSPGDLERENLSQESAR